jgi:hypothetical protein
MHVPAAFPTGKSPSYPIKRGLDVLRSRSAVRRMEK